MPAERTVVLFADYVCPFSYLAAVGLENVAARLGLTIERRAFELSPHPQPVAEPATPEAWQIVRDLAEKAGVRIEHSPLVPRTQKAHEAVKIAAVNGKAAAMDRALYEAYFLRGEDIGRIDVIVALATSLGMDAMAVKVALDLDVHSDAVKADRAAAEALEITGTPALVAGNDVHIGLLSEQQMLEWLGD